MINLYLDPEGNQIFPAAQETGVTGRDITNIPNGLVAFNHQQSTTSETETISSLKERIKKLESRQTQESLQSQ